MSIACPAWITGLLVLARGARRPVADPAVAGIVHRLTVHGPQGQAEAKSVLKVLVPAADH